MNHKRKRPASRRAGCKLCKPWKKNGATQDDIGTLRNRNADKTGDGLRFQSLGIAEGIGIAPRIRKEHAEIFKLLENS